MGMLDSSFQSLPYARACRRVDFDFVEVREAARLGGGRLLLVSGVKSWADLRVTLEPLPYREMPDFWMIEVVGRLTASGLPALMDFCVALPLASIQGCKGIEIVGATKSERRVLNPNVGTDARAGY
ncbi:MAG TPA: hypothetical protein VF814_04190 [Casimicrobiaceae bacterium]